MAILGVGVHGERGAQAYNRLGVYGQSSRKLKVFWFSDFIILKHRQSPLFIRVTFVRVVPTSIGNGTFGDAPSQKPVNEST